VGLKQRWKDETGKDQDSYLKVFEALVEDPLASNTICKEEKYILMGGQSCNAIMQAKRTKGCSVFLFSISWP